MSTILLMLITFLISLIISVVLFSAPITPNYMLFYILIGLSTSVGLFSDFINNTLNIKNKFSTLSFVVVISTLIILPIVNSSIFHSKEFANSLNIQEVNASNLVFDSHRTVTLSMANIIANKVLGKKFNGVQISSQYEINLNSSSVQVVNNELVWVMPLDFSGFFKWISQDYVPGYVIVSATNPELKANLVLDYKITVSKNSFFMSYIDRVAFIRSGFSEIDTHFEISDSGEPYYISLITKPTVFLNSKTANEILVTNAQTGDSVKLSFNEAQIQYPWIDRLISEDYTEEKIEWYGSLQNGFWNTIFEGLNINKPTVYNKRELWFVQVNGRTMYFTGMSSINGNDQSLVQGILVDTKSRESFSFDLSGVMDESGAVSVIDSSLGANSIKWEPVLPQPFIIEGSFYWGSPIVSTSGIYQQVGLVKGDEPSKVYSSKRYSSAIANISFNLIDSNDSLTSEVMVSISKRKLNKILNKIEELNQLIKDIR